MELEKCAVCDAEFKPGYLDGEPCEVCKKLFPGATSKDNKFKKKSTKEEDKITNDIKKEVNSILEEYGILKKCVCGKLYYKRSPAQKGCGCKYDVDDKETS